MSFYTGTQCELLYAMPGSGAAATGTTATAQLLTQNSATAPGLPYQLPANFFTQQSGGGPGKSLLVKGGGWWSTGANGGVLTFTMVLDAAAGTYGAGGLLGATGAITLPISITDGAWDFEYLITCASLATGANTLLNGVGHLSIGTAANAAVASMSSSGPASNACGTVMIGAPSSGTKITNSNAYFFDVFASWATTTNAPTITMTNFLVFGLN